MRTLPREPWLGSQICGYEVVIGDGPMLFCGERKAEGLPFCMTHAEDYEAEYAPFNVKVADCVALGNHRWAVRLLWQPCCGDGPEEPTAAETVAYAASLAAS